MSWTFAILLFFSPVGQLFGDDTVYAVEERESIPFVRIPAGQFLMGTGASGRSALKAAGWWSRFLESETPAHAVVIEKPFLIGVTEVTQEQWTRVMGKAHSQVVFKGSKRPVDSVSWGDVQRFLKKLNEGSEHRFRLPSEAEWEYCCRAGDWGLFMVGERGCSLTSEEVSSYSWFKSNSEGTSHPVATRTPNAWGLHDMLGNVWEWCEDSYCRDVYQSRESGVRNSRYQKRFPERVIRGGSWYLPLAYQRSGLRSGFQADKRSPYVGFRIACELAEKVGGE